MSPWAVQDLFGQLAAQPCYGGDGGNPKCRIWTVGIEEGPPVPNLPLDNIPEQYCFQTEDGQSIPCWNEHFRRDHPQCQNLPFMRMVSRLIERIFDHGWANPYEHFLGRDGHGFHLNLYPLAAKNLEEWKPAHVKFSGFPDKSLYRAWCAAHRFPGLRRLAQDYSPRVILCSAPRRFRDHFLAAFGEAADLSNGETHQIGKHRIDEISVNRNRTRLLISPFFGRGGLMKNLDVNALARLVREMVR